MVGPLNPYRDYRLPPVGEAVLLASHMLYQVKKYVSNCSGRSVFTYLGDDVSVHADADFDPLGWDKYSESFERIIADLFYAGADLDTNDVRVSLKVKLIDENIR